MTLTMGHQGKKVTVKKELYPTGSVRLYLESEKGEMLHMITVGLGHITNQVACISTNNESQVIANSLIHHGYLTHIGYTTLSGSSTQVKVCQVNW